MSNDAGQTTETSLSLGDAALLSAFAKLFKSRVVPQIDAKADAVKAPLLAAYEDPDSGIKSIDVRIGGVPVATHTVSVSRGKYEVGDEEKFTAYADDCGEAEAIIQVRPAFRDAMLKRAAYDKATGNVVDKITGEVIPGVRYIPGGQPTGSISTTWKDGGQEALEAAYASGQLSGLLNGVPMLPASEQQ
ncbi:hypothetical protein [Streptomyces sp. NRRL B-24572]|uniref:hypothetical protein n=1 Tax=Streptomyces sp. NRRL B-24572 TaxID=1962156 RepID=UPI000A387CF6|nr:hypothetical protein [Streptomyces sp. NRRL B-24572]